MYRDEINANDTIDRMVRNLNPKMFDFPKVSSSFKRSMTSLSDLSSNDDQTPKKQKLDTSANTSYLGSPCETRRLRADLLEARNTILTLENRIEDMHNVRKGLEIMYENETQVLKKQRDYDRKSIEQLEEQLQNLRKRKLAWKQKYDELNEKYVELEERHQSKVMELEKSVHELKVNGQEQKSDDAGEISGLQRRISELEMLLESVEEDAKAHKKLSEELEKKLSGKNAVERDLELKQQALQSALLQIKELKFERESYQESLQQIKTQQYKINKFPELERENQNLREENFRIKDEIRNKLLLEEEVYDLKSRLAKHKEQEGKLMDMQMKQTHLELQLEEYRTVARALCDESATDSALPHLLRQLVERLQQQEIALTAEKVQMQSQLNEALHEAKSAKLEMEKHQKHTEEMRQTQQQQQTLIHRMKKKIMLLTRERDSYRLQLDSYEKDLTICISSGSSGGQPSIQQSQKERIENLEKIIEDYRDMIGKLEADLKSSEHVEHRELPVREDQQLRLKQEVDALRLTNSKLRERCDQLETQLEKLMINPDTPDGRVFHLAKNPVSEHIEQREQKIGKLQEEIERLKRKIKNMEDGLEGSQLSDISMCPKEAAVLREQIKTVEAQSQRLKECYKSRMQEFRNVVYMLLGYKIDIISSQYKLTSMYADSQDDHFCFQLNQKGEMDLLGNEFSAAVDDLIDLHLRQQKSIPVFLSAVTLDLFQNRTKMFDVDE